MGDLVTHAAATAHLEAGLHSGWGGFAERGIVRDADAMDEDGVADDGWSSYGSNQVLPMDLDPVDATLIINWRETWSYITRMGVSYGARVLVIGTGGVGLSFINHARNLRAAEVVAIGSPGRFDLARRLGASQCLDYHVEDMPKTLTSAYATDFDFAIDAVGKRGGLDGVLPTLKPGGKIGLYGVDEYYSVTVMPTLARGSFTVSQEGYAEKEATESVLRLIREGQLVPDEFYDRSRIFPLSEISAAFEATKNREMVKAVVKCS
jgi:L-iditol 2-dehydrogenase